MQYLHRGLSILVQQRMIRATTNRTGMKRQVDMFKAKAKFM